MIDLERDILKPTGYHILLKTEAVNNVTESGIITSTEGQRSREETGNDIHEVIAMGPDCYKNLEKFPNGPWCKVGDRVMTANYPGHKIKIGEDIYWYTSDEDILATVEKHS